MDGEHAIAVVLLIICAIAAIGLMFLFQPAADLVQAVANASDSTGHTAITIGDPNRADECGSATAIGDNACNKHVFDVSPASAGLAFLGLTIPLSVAVFFALFAVGAIAFSRVR